MGILDGARRLVWPEGAPRPLRDERPAAGDGAKALGDATVPYERDVVVNWPWQDEPGGIGLVGGLSASYAALYRKQPWVYIAVNKLSRGIARLPLKGYRRDPVTDERARERGTPLAALLARPYPGGTPFALKSAIVGDLAVYGNALLIKQGGGRGRAPAALFPVSPVGWSIDGDGGYRWREPQTARERVYAPERIVHFRYWRPGSDALGLSPLEPLRMTLAIEDAAQRLGVAAFANGARPSGVLRTEQDISKERLAVLREGIARMYRGVDKTGLPAILTNGLDWKAMSWDMQQAAVVEFRKLTREEVAAVYDIPPVLLGILDRATFSNVEELHLAFYQDTLGPWTTLIEETFQAQLLADVDDWAESYLEFDMNEVLKGAIAQRFNAYRLAVGGPWLSANEARARENLPKSDQAEADAIRFPLNMSSRPGSEQEGGQPNVGA